MDTDRRPTILYTAAPALWFRILTIVIGAAVTAMLGTSVAIGVFGGKEPAWIAVLIVLPALAAVPTIVVLGNLMRFTVSTEGVRVRGFLQTRHIRWEQVAVVEVDRRAVGRGGTVLVHTDGRRIRSGITQARAALRRGERTADHGPDLLRPARPTVAAIDGHRWFLHRGHRPPDFPSAHTGRV
ncbi:PH domain-containing protein [Brachybacterium sacelli]|uniref:Low molecular weight protein antigen 6 PH domain-containing protein n=1 Tax=Brachybacterium sacelli TaxID=173364 RepID=A0ABS4X6E1_9MICO|nr:PH domain-containing protein [Brachybacterium sacelli]MBP2383926.1 hypothetical protein [Brachybacterium sacelli]